MKFKSLFLALVVFGTESLFGYALEGQSWTLNRTVVMQLSLGPSKTLLDGSTSFNQSAQNALEIWNPYLAHMAARCPLGSRWLKQEAEKGDVAQPLP